MAGHPAHVYPSIIFPMAEPDVNGACCGCPGRVVLDGGSKGCGGGGDIVMVVVVSVVVAVVIVVIIVVVVAVAVLVVPAALLVQIIGEKL